MKVLTPQISWHAREPLFSVDFHVSGRVATAGADNEVKIWRFEKSDSNNGLQMFTFLASLKRHLGSVNVVRFSPNGQYLASGSDDGVIFIWQLNTNVAPTKEGLIDDEEEENKEVWTTVASLRGHTDVYDLCWSPDSTQIISGSTDNTAIIWDAISGKIVQQIKEHSHYVQGVSWDPRGNFVVTQSSDRTVRILGKKKEKSRKTQDSKEFLCVQSLNKREFENQVPKDENMNTLNQQNQQQQQPLVTPAPKQQHRMFEDETINSFFRRSGWTPDGSLLIIPAGIFQQSPTATLQHTTYIFARNSWNKPAAHLPGSQKPTICVRSNPHLYKRKFPENSPLLRSEFRMIFAVASLDNVIIYDTESFYPISLIEGIHYAELTDLTWSTDGNTLLISSKDGYCTVVMFEEGELGEKVH